MASALRFVKIDRALDVISNVIKLMNARLDTIATKTWVLAQTFVLLGGLGAIVHLLR